MSELISNYNRNCYRWSLLATVSALALMGSIDAGEVLAETDNSRPTVWLELGAQLEGVVASEAQFAPPFVLATPRPAPETVSPLDVNHSPRHALSAEGKLTLAPENTDWVFSVGVRYGRSNSHKHVHQQSYPTQPTGFTCDTCTPKYQRAVQFMDTATQHSESHTVLDFQAGRDIGIGLLGGHTSALLNFGVRIAQFGSRGNVAFKSDPDSRVVIHSSGGLKFRYGATYHSNHATLSSTRSFRGIGPSVSLAASTPIAGSEDSGHLAVDWGANAALLFGRQKAKVSHHSTSLYHQGKYGTFGGSYRTTTYKHAPPDQLRARSAIVPNIGAFAGLSLVYSAAKVSFGYRADFFLGAMDGGIDKRKSENVGFYGPFATISVGLGG